MLSNVRVSIEGEGLFAGCKTYLVDHIVREGSVTFSDLDFSSSGGIRNLYVRSESADDAFLTELRLFLLCSLARKNISVTLEVPVERASAIEASLAGFADSVCVLYLADRVVHLEGPGLRNSFIKMNLRSVEVADSVLAAAVAYTDMGRRVIIMPTVHRVNEQKNPIGDWVIRSLKHIPPSIRIAPPLHQILDIP
jgi:hypothetical protein